MAKSKSSLLGCPFRTNSLSSHSYQGKAPFIDNLCTYTRITRNTIFVNTLVTKPSFAILRNISSFVANLRFSISFTQIPYYSFVISDCYLKDNRITFKRTSFANKNNKKRGKGLLFTLFVYNTSNIRSNANLDWNTNLNCVKSASLTSGALTNPIFGRH